ncbi:MAG TPA: SDR family oxidoreductase [Nitrososphaera sp.]|jgi:NAD(P)-dependent dehydrogenase (short-subunit alcohol dehydrogenase family)|nr:SDR family oxidoreductase [Nitrososphaera sp.]
MGNLDMKKQNERVKGGKVAVVTGSSSGIGYATALQLARSGYLTFATMRNPSKGADLVKAAESEGLPIQVEELDVTSHDSVSKAITRISTSVGRIDILVNNAGFATFGSLEDLSIKEIQNQIDTNLLGTVRVTQQVLPVMRKQGSGIIVNISSMLGRLAFPGLPAYIATEFALEGLSESLSYEVAPFGIKVVLIEPGPVRTKALDNRVRAQGSLREDSPYFDILKGLDSSLKSLFERASTADEVAMAIVEAISSNEPKLRYPVGENPAILLEKKRELTDEQFADYVRNMIANPAPSHSF